MSDSSSSQLPQLEGALNEFFSPSVNSNRKRSIELSLAQYRDSIGSWRQCMSFMMNSNNNYVHWYCIDVIGRVVDRSWVSLGAGEQLEIRTAVFKFLVARHRSLPVFVCNKLSKVIVDIAKHDWPHNYPEFLNHIVELVQSSNGTRIGLTLLKTLSQELGGMKITGVLAQRARELKSQLTNHSSSILQVIVQILELEYDQSATASNGDNSGIFQNTPASSPLPVRASQAQPILSPTNNLLSPQSPLDQFGTSPSHSPYGSPTKGGFMERAAMLRREVSAANEVEFSEESRAICLEGLQCLLDYFSWVPLSSLITPRILAIVFKYARLNDKDAYDLGISAVMCVNELFAKQCVPEELGDFLTLMFRQTITLLSQITVEKSTRSVSPFEDADEQYVDLLIEFLRLFVTHHLQKIESAGTFPIVDFLSLLFRFTFMQTRPEAFSRCLEVWIIFLDGLVNIESRDSAANRRRIEQYKVGLLAFMRELLKTIRFSCNGAQLLQLDDTVSDADSRTDWDIFLTGVANAVSRVADLFPVDVMHRIYPIFNDNSNNFMNVHLALTESHGRRTLDLVSGSDGTRVFCLIRDLASMLHLFGCLSTLFIIDFVDRFEAAGTLLARACEIGRYCAQLGLLQQGVQPITLLQAEILNYLRSSSHWLAHYRSAVSQESAEAQQQFRATVNEVFRLAVSTVMMRDLPEKISLAAALLLRSLTVTVRPTFTGSIPEFSNLIQKPVLSWVSLPVRCAVAESVAAALLLPWHGIPANGQEWGDRSVAFVGVVNELFSGFKRLAAGGEVSSEMVADSAHLLAGIVRVVSADGNKQAKVILSEHINGILELCPGILRRYTGTPSVLEELLDVFLAVFDCLRRHVTSEFTEDTVKTFMALFSSQSLSSSIRGANAERSTRIVERFLDVLRYLVEGSGGRTSAYLPDILSLCLDQLCPLVRWDENYSDVALIVAPPLFSLLHTILLSNWRYFALSASELCGDPEREAKFVGILETFALSLDTLDIGIFRQNLNHLYSLNEKRNLYSGGIFRQRMRSHFVVKLITVLVDGSLSVLSDDIIQAVHAMASVDFKSFFSEILPAFMASHCSDLKPNQQAELASGYTADTDYPSFSLTLCRFVGDVNYHRSSNEATGTQTPLFTQ